MITNMQKKGQNSMLLSAIVKAACCSLEHHMHIFQKSMSVLIFQYYYMQVPR
jgi:hypothetical protein